MARASQSVARRDPADDASASAYSGRLLLRMPSRLHEELATMAEREAMSLNQLITTILAAGVGRSAPKRAPAAARIDRTAAARSRAIGIALAVNAVVLVVAGALAVALLVVALRG